MFLYLMCLVGAACLILFVLLLPDCVDCSCLFVLFVFLCCVVVCLFVLYLLYCFFLVRVSAFLFFAWLVGGAFVCVFVNCLFFCLCL